MLPLAHQLNDSHLLNVSHEYIAAILDRQTPDGWAGPVVGGQMGQRSPWPRYRLLTVLAQYTELFPEVKKRRFCDAILIQNALFYQDRLGTNIGKALKKECRFLRCAT
jgi:hypothetical protein